MEPEVAFVLGVEYLRQQSLLWDKPREEPEKAAAVFVTRLSDRTEPLPPPTGDNPKANILLQFTLR